MIEWINYEKLKSLFNNQAKEKARLGLRQALYEEALIMMRNSQRRVPVDTGVLRASGIVMPPIQRGKTSIVELGYGGAASAYAMRQHETEDYKHKSGKTWKYLENPVRERIPQLETSLAKRLNRILNGMD